MPALTRPPPISFVKEIPVLLARQLRNNDLPWDKKPSIPAPSSGGSWWTSKKFWIIAGIILGIVFLLGIALCAGSASEKKKLALEEPARRAAQAAYKKRVDEQFAKELPFLFDPEWRRQEKQRQNNLTLYKIKEVNDSTTKLLKRIQMEDAKQDRIDKAKARKEAGIIKKKVRFADGTKPPA
ncbi:hypothetical protein NW768_002589 [Fusarium equiseti]|uniref:Uncharacterized protein n=1 Tax=Fusarium equiseti TaxID=61235 RepID=A0ABQ8RP78_FUSEQ|nr:hypothetical protein NW768_002589 [Fusarium equiseti]